MEKISIKSLRKMATANGFVCWQDYLYEYQLNGNNLRNVCDKLTRREVLEVIDAVVSMMLNCDTGGWDINVLRRMYTQAFCSLSDRL